MDQAVIFKPFLATMVLTIVVWIYMYVRRLYFIYANNLDAKKMTPGELARVSPPSVSSPSDNLKNLLELPTIFYAVVLFLFATHNVDAIYLNLAWGFVAFRILHSAVHCTFNFIPLRFVLYVVSALALWCMVVRAVMAAMG
jgi:hypothetical protein